ncbi:MAG: MBL fold metallo-hydrolase [Actinomycetota bacterium]
MFGVTFHGVRGSTPCHGREIVGYGGNTSCVSVNVPGAAPILFDMGTGLRYFGANHTGDAAFAGTFLLSHLHWDHIQGLPFFGPILQRGAEIDVYAPEQVDGRTVQDIFADTIRPPLFPVDLAHLPGDMRFHEVYNTDFELAHPSGDPTDAIRVTARSIPHVGPTLGYRLEWRGRSVVYMSDHQMPCDGSFSVTDGALELCRDADLVIHDAQYTPDEFEGRCDWGHCTIDYAVWFAGEAGAKRLALFHHDPSHDDAQLDALVEAAAESGRSRGVEVFGSREGMSVAI